MPIESTLPPRVVECEKKCNKWNSYPYNNMKERCMFECTYGWPSSNFYESYKALANTSSSGNKKSVWVWIIIAIALVIVIIAVVLLIRKYKK